MFKVFLFVLMVCTVDFFAKEPVDTKNWKSRVKLGAKPAAMSGDKANLEEKKEEKPSPKKDPAPALEQKVEKTQTKEAKKIDEPKTALPEEKKSPEKQKKEPEKVDSTISIPYMSEASLSTLINFMCELKGIDLIPLAETNDAKVSLSIKEPMSKEAAWEVFLTVLDYSGFALIRIGALHKIVKKDAVISGEPLPVVHVGTPAEKIPESSQMIRYVFFLKNIPVTQAEGLIRGFLSPGAFVEAQPNIGAIILGDRAISIKAAAGILESIDNAGQKERCKIIRLERSVAADVKKFLNDLTEKSAANDLSIIFGGRQSEGGADFFPGNVKLVTDERTNSLIMLGTEAALVKLSNFVTEYFEGNWTSRVPFQTYECQFMAASEIKRMFEDLINQSASGGAGGKSSGRALGSVRMESDEHSNKLIIYAQDARDLEMTNQLIAELDKPQPMVALECLIVQVSIKDLKELGGRIRSMAPGTPVPGMDFQSAGRGNFRFQSDSNSGAVKSILGDLIGNITASPGATAVAIGQKLADGTSSVWAILQALTSWTNATVVSKPFVTVANGGHAVLNIGQERNVRFENPVTGSTDANAGSYKSVSATTELDMSPQISPDGLINLDMSVKIEDFAGAPLGSNASDANKLTQNFKTTITLADGQLLVIGGFVKTANDQQATETPLLSKIPFLGWFTKLKTDSVQKTYTFMFLSPTILRTRTTPGIGLYSKMKLHEATDKMEELSGVSKNDPIDRWFFGKDEKVFSHKIIDFSNAKYQPTNVDIKNDPLYRGKKISESDFYTTEKRPVPKVEKVPLGEEDYFSLVNCSKSSERLSMANIEKKQSPDEKAAIVFAGKPLKVAERQNQVDNQNKLVKKPAKKRSDQKPERTAEPELPKKSVPQKIGLNLSKARNFESKRESFNSQSSHNDEEYLDLHQEQMSENFDADKAESFDFDDFKVGRLVDPGRDFDRKIYAMGPKGLSSRQKFSHFLDQTDDQVENNSKDLKITKRFSSDEFDFDRKLREIVTKKNEVRG